MQLLKLIGGWLGGAGMAKYIFRRMLLGIPVLLIIILIAFSLLKAIPGGPFTTVGGKPRDAQSLDVLNARYGLDKPLLLNLPNDGFSPDIDRENFTFYERLPDCQKLREGLTRQEATPENAVERETGWYLLRMTTEHYPVYLELKTADGRTDRQRCNEKVMVAYSDLTRSQFMQYLNNVLRGNFGPALGQSSRGREVGELIRERLPPSIVMGLLTTFFGFLVGVPIGVIMALYRNKFPDYSLTFISMLGASIPTIVLAPTLLILFTVVLRAVPTPKPQVWLSPNFFDTEFTSRLVLPLFVLTLGFAAFIARLTRASLLQVLGDDYIRTARSKGLRERIVVYLHALKNALIPVATTLGPLLAGIVSGSLFVERIFGIPGIGDTFITSITERDYYLLCGVTILYSTFLILGNIMVDVMYTWLDPRIRFD